MAKYFIRSSFISRKRGSKVTSAAAYRAGERIRDERTGDSFNHSERSDVLYKEILLPQELATRPDMIWAYDRSNLWNRVELSSRRRDALLAREWLVMLPHELYAQERRDLARRFARELADTYHCAVDLCIHPPRPRSDMRHHHAHVLMTVRQITPQGFGRRTDLELSGSYRRQLGIPGSSRECYQRVRVRWAELTNEALRDAGLSARVDHRSLAEQGINREPEPTIPPAVRYAEQKSQMPLAAGEAIRAQHRERVAAREQGPEELARVIQRQKAQSRERALEHASKQKMQPRKIPWGALTREEQSKVRSERYRARVSQLDEAGLERKRARARAASQRYRQRHPEASRQAVRKWQSKHPEAHRQHSRDHYNRHAEEITRNRYARRLLLAAEQQRSMGASHSREESVRRWKEYREKHGTGPTREQAAERWNAYRERQERERSMSNSLEEGTGLEHVVEHEDHRQMDHDYDLGM